MQVLAGPFAAAAALLVVAGAAKVRRPGPTTAALRGLRVRVRPPVVVALGGAEAAIGFGALVFGWRWIAALVAACYLGFAAFVTAALARRGAVASCGCFGQAETPPTRLHLGLNLAAAAVAALVALGPARLDLVTAAGAGGEHLLLLGFVGTSAWLAYLGLSLLPQTMAAANGDRGR
jgi:methylamine utilization protein MauE